MLTFHKWPLTALFPPAPGGGQQVDHGYKGKGVLLHLLVDKNGRPLSITTTGAKGDERQEVKALLRQLPCQSLRGRMSALEADKG